MIRVPGVVVLDANILIRLSDPLSPVHETTKEAVTFLVSQGWRLHTFPQTLFEYWAVVTRPQKNNGLGLTIEEAGHDLNSFELLAPVLPDVPAQAMVWRRLVAQYCVAGKQCHDARYIASLVAQGLSNFLTYDADFSRYSGEGITLINPADLILKSSE